MKNRIPALMIIDMQAGMSLPSARSRNNLQAEVNIGKLLVAWRKVEASVIAVLSSVRYSSIDKRTSAEYPQERPLRKHL